MDLIEQLSQCSTKQERYNVVVEFMEKSGIQFKTVQKDHINNCYRIMNNGSSIFVYESFFRLNLCEEDKNRLKDVKEIQLQPNYKNKSKQVIDNVRPYTCSFGKVETLITTIELLCIKKNGANINNALAPTSITNNKDGHICCICPNCGIEFVKAPRCPECGQLIKYRINSI